VSACDFCAQAAREMCHGFNAKCRGCNARAAARSQPFFEARKAGKRTLGYRTLLERLGVTHDEVLAASKADRLKDRP
jgi:hypothetical protein